MKNEKCWNKQQKFLRKKCLMPWEVTDWTERSESKALRSLAKAWAHLATLAGLGFNFFILCLFGQLVLTDQIPWSSILVSFDLPLIYSSIPPTPPFLCMDAWPCLPFGWICRPPSTHTKCPSSTILTNGNRVCRETCTGSLSCLSPTQLPCSGLETCPACSSKSTANSLKSILVSSCSRLMHFIISVSISCLSLWESGSGRDPCGGYVCHDEVHYAQRELPS